MRRNLVGMLSAILGSMLWTGLAAAMPAGMVIAVSGSCIDRGRALERGDAVQVSDTITAPEGCHLQLRMADGSVISVAPDSGLTVASYNVGSSGRYAKILLVHGLLRIFTHLVRGSSTFEVSTTVATASVRSGSADWFIRAQAGSAQAGVLAGKVDLTSAATGRSVSIPARWGTRNEAGLDAVLPRRWARREFSAVIHITSVANLGSAHRQS